MTYETVVPELFSRFPEMRARYSTDFAYMGDDEPLPYTVFGSLVIPSLEAALERQDLGAILRICAYLEDVAASTKVDNRLTALLQVEVGEWLGGAANEELLSPWLGAETKRISGYVPGLATQRRNDKVQQHDRRLTVRASSLLRRVLGR